MVLEFSNRACSPKAPCPQSIHDAYAVTHVTRLVPQNAVPSVTEKRLCVCTHTLCSVSNPKLIVCRCENSL